MTKIKESVLVTSNISDIHFGTSDYIHIDIDGNEGWNDEVIRNGSFVDRWLAEQDSTTLQLIPYVACITKDGKVLSYQRKGGGEGRLEGKRSIGIGGHVNITDAIFKVQTGDVSWKTVLNGAVRELVEELEITEEYVRENLRQVGTLYTPTDQGGDVVGPGPNVGEVHIGILYVLEVDRSVTIKEDEGMINPEFIETGTGTAGYEQWSRLFIQELPNIIKQL